MRVIALHAGIELQLAASPGMGLRFEPFQQHLSVALGTVGLIGAEIVHVEDLAVVEHLHIAVAGHRPHFVAFKGSRQPVSIGLHHPPHSGQIVFRFHGWPQLAHDFAGGHNLFIAGDRGDMDTLLDWHACSLIVSSARRKRREW